MAHFAAALLLVHALSQAQIPRCEAPQTQAEMNTCAALEFFRSDARLNLVYQKVLKRIDPTRLPKLRAAQRAWLAFRDAQCAFEGSESEGGTMQPMLVSGCKSEVTKARTEQLRAELTAGK
jgi:uncharacterized protein YecT (DUF1311 family)